MILIRARWRSIVLVGDRGWPPNVMLDQVVAKGLAAHSESCSFKRLALLEGPKYRI
jgi:hypothetical protein